MADFMGVLGRTFGRQRAGQPVSARRLNEPIAAAEAQSRRRVGPGLASMEVAGQPLERDARRTGLWARLVASLGSGAYSWQGVYGDRGAPQLLYDLPAHVAGGSGGDACYEVNGNDALAAGTRVWLAREWTSGSWVFMYDKCT